MTTFVLCNECGNRWKVCIFLPPRLCPSTHRYCPPEGVVCPQPRRGLTSLCSMDLQSWRSWWVAIGEAGRECAGMCSFWKESGWDGSSGHISSEDGQVPHLSTEGGSCSTPTPNPRIHRGKTTALYTWTTLLYKVLYQMSFPLNLAVARMREAELGQRALSPPGHPPFPRRLWKSLRYPRLPQLPRRQRLCFQT